MAPRKNNADLKLAQHKSTWALQVLIIGLKIIKIY